MKEESEKVGLKLNIQKTKIMASGPITSWEIDGETVETVADFIFLGPKITADGDHSHEITPLVVLCLGHKICCTNWSLILLLLLIFPPFCLIQVFALQICGFHSFSVALTHLYLLLEPKVCLKSCFIKYQL